MGIHINPTVSEKIAKIKKGGPQELFFVSDFDRTMTKAKFHGEEVVSGLSIFHHGNYLHDPYANQAQELWDYYYPKESNIHLSEDERFTLMKEWYDKHVALFVQYKLSKDIISQAAQSHQIKLRDGTDVLLNRCSELDIPFIVFSAGSGDVIKELFDMEKLLHTQVSICSNYFSFTPEGVVNGFSSEIIHSYNKNKIDIHTHGVSESVKEKPHLVLMGDSLKDPTMGEHFHPETILKVGFCHNVDLLAQYRRLYDVVLTGDGSFEPVLDLLGLAS